MESRPRRCGPPLRTRRRSHDASSRRARGPRGRRRRRDGAARRRGRLRREQPRRGCCDRRPWTAPAIAAMGAPRARRHRRRSCALAPARRGRARRARLGDDEPRPTAPRAAALSARPDAACEILIWPRRAARWRPLVCGGRVVCRGAISSALGVGGSRRRRRDGTGCACSALAAVRPACGRRPR